LSIAHTTILYQISGWFVNRENPEFWCKRLRKRLHWSKEKDDVSCGKLRKRIIFGVGKRIININSSCQHSILSRR
jgi:hypothetical protein